jgi:hypothetical protein
VPGEEPGADGEHHEEVLMTVVCRSEVVCRVRSLVQTENSMRRQISDLEKKELAYTKTIQEQHTAFTSHFTL